MDILSLAAGVAVAFFVMLVGYHLGHRDGHAQGTAEAVERFYAGKPVGRPLHPSTGLVRDRDGIRRGPRTLAEIEREGERERNA